MVDPKGPIVLGEDEACQVEEYYANLLEELNQAHERNQRLDRELAVL